MEGLNLEIRYKASIYGPNPKKPGETKVLFKRKTKRAVIAVEDILAVIQYHGLDGKLAKDRCEIIHANLGNLVVDTPYLEMSAKTMDRRMVVKGFKQYRQKK
jgi:hypothetical protein